MNGNRWKVVGAIGGVLGLLTGGLKVWEFAATQVREAMEQRVNEAQWRHTVEDRLCTLEGKTFRKGECQ